MLQPKYQYTFTNAKDLQNYDYHASKVKLIDCDGRSGVNLGGIRDALVLPDHTANEEKGAVSFWMMSMEDLYPAAHHDNHGESNPHFCNYNIISDNQAGRDFDSATFLLNYSTDWHPVFTGKFFRGNVSVGYYCPDGPHAQATANYFHFLREQWYHILFSWDKENSEYRIYANGVLVGIEDYGEKPLLAHPVAQQLYIGNPNWVYSEINFYDKLPVPADVKGMYQVHKPAGNDPLDKALADTYEGVTTTTFSPGNQDQWQTQLSLPLTETGDLGKFHIQGCTEAPRITADGLMIQTPKHSKDYFKKIGALAETHPKKPLPDYRQVYLWSKEMFAGDIHVSYEFKSLAYGGLSLLMVHASGMQGESFLDDYFATASGSMRSVCWADIRNYHWEYYRQMHDTRHDMISHAAMKNPWFRPMGFQLYPGSWALDRWYRLDYKQEGNRIQCAIDNQVVLDMHDDPSDNNGPVFRKGHIAIRCMINSHMLFRNLTVATKAKYSALEL
jgi:hypothetical protein